MDAQDFLDQAKCKSVAQNQLDAGSQVVFGVAGPCGLGALDAAVRANPEDAYNYPALASMAGNSGAAPEGG